MRYLPKSVIIAGVIPGPHEPSKTVNTILEPFVKDLLALWDGIYISIPSLSLPVRIRSILLCISCDIPACRKVCSFLGHNANLAYSKCTKFFNGNVHKGYTLVGLSQHHGLPETTYVTTLMLRLLRLCYVLYVCYDLMYLHWV